MARALPDLEKAIQRKRDENNARLWALIRRRQEKRGRGGKGSAYGVTPEEFEALLRRISRPVAARSGQGN